jgi:thymidylate synthase
MMAHVCSLEAGDFIHTFGDAHLYANHFDQARLQLQRQPRKLPRLELNPRIDSIFDFSHEDIRILDYDPHPHIKGKVAV